MKTLILLRGCSGAGKSTLGAILSEDKYPVISADMYFENNGQYKFKPEKLGDAHAWCQNAVEKAMQTEYEKIFVANTFTQEWEMKIYFELAKKYNYMIFSCIVENRNNTSNVHNVPSDSLQKQKERFNIKL
jgi:predicted kinase